MGGLLRWFPGLLPTPRSHGADRSQILSILRTLHTAPLCSRHKGKYPIEIQGPGISVAWRAEEAGLIFHPLKAKAQNPKPLIPFIPLDNRKSRWSLPSPEPQFLPKPWWYGFPNPQTLNPKTLNPELEALNP